MMLLKALCAEKFSQIKGNCIKLILQSQAIASSGKFSNRVVGLPVRNSTKLDSVPSRENCSALTQRCPGQLCKFSKAEQN